MRRLAILLCFGLLACDSDSNPVPEVAPTPPPAAATPAGRAAAPAVKNPFAENALDATQRYRFEGTVHERVRAGSYLYLRVEDDAGRASWVASLAATTPDVARVSVLVMARAEEYHSKRLQRVFAPLLFGIVRAIRG